MLWLPAWYTCAQLCLSSFNWVDVKEFIVDSIHFPSIGFATWKILNKDVLMLTIFPEQEGISWHEDTKQLQIKIKKNNLNLNIRSLCFYAMPSHCYYCQFFTKSLAQIFTRKIVHIGKVTRKRPIGVWRPFMVDWKI
jgi:hypothetical protein